MLHLSFKRFKTWSNSVSVLDYMSFYAFLSTGSLLRAHQGSAIVPLFSHIFPSRSSLSIFMYFLEAKNHQSTYWAYCSLSHLIQQLLSIAILLAVAGIATARFAARLTGPVSNADQKCDREILRIRLSRHE